MHDSDNDSEILNKEIDFGDDDEVNSYVEENDKKWKEERNKLPSCIIRHNAKFRLRWDLCVILFTLYNCVSIPYEVGFEGGFSDNVAIVVLDYFIDFLFGLDIIFNFRTTYVNSKTGTEVSPISIRLLLQ